MLSLLPFIFLKQSNSMVVDRLVLTMCPAKIDLGGKDKHVYHLVFYTDCVFNFLSHAISVCVCECVCARAHQGIGESII